MVTAFGVGARESVKAKQRTPSILGPVAGGWGGVDDRQYEPLDLGDCRPHSGSEVRLSC